jgi:hypothetical protein
MNINEDKSNIGLIEYAIPFVMITTLAVLTVASFFMVLENHNNSNKQCQTSTQSVEQK